MKRRKDLKIYLNVDLTHAGWGSTVIWGRVPLAVTDHDILEIINGDTTPVSWRAIWIESAAARPAELVKEGLAPIVLEPQNMGAHLSVVILIYTSDDFLGHNRITN